MSKSEPTKPVKPADDPEVRQLFEFTKKRPVPFADLCDKLDVSPSKAKAIIQRAIDAGLNVRVGHDQVGIEIGKELPRVQRLKIAPVVGKPQRVGVLSDIHFGSKYCLRDELKDCVHWMYDRGIREIVIPGDILDGSYRHSKFERTHEGVEDQTEDCFQHLPHLPDLNYRAITGNHDMTLTDDSGVDVGRYISMYFREHGREDFHSYGDRGAFLEMFGAVIHLWHPSGSMSYAKTYSLQKKIESYSPGMKPNILLTGHYHQAAYMEERGIHALLCPTFHGGQSAFGKSLKGSPVAIGGYILQWELTKDGTMRNFTPERRSYFERDELYEIADFESIEVKDVPDRGKWAKRFRAAGKIT